MTTKTETGVWKAGELATDTSSELERELPNSTQALSYPEAAWWGIRTKYKLFAKAVAVALGWDTTLQTFDDAADTWDNA